MDAVRHTRRIVWDGPDRRHETMSARHHAPRCHLHAAGQHGAGAPAGTVEGGTLTVGSICVSAEDAPDDLPSW